MKKFLAVFDGYRLSKSTLAYTQEMAYMANSHLVSVFLDEFFYRTYNVVNVLKTSDKPDEIIKQLDEKDKKKRDEAVRIFEQSCGKAKIKFSVHRDRNVAIQELKHESMFADLIIIS